MSSCRTEADGDSLGECTTNVFVLADARGLRWKKFANNYSSATTISEDPVLSAYSKALSHNLMCIWQRSTNFNQSLKEEPGSNKLLDCPKELILFWYGEEPALTAAISSSLNEVSSGCFDAGFSPEYQNHFYKALHNLIEQHLVHSGFVRIGKWFLRPLENDCSKKDSAAFSFSFFIYGESLVVTSVDVEKRHSVRRLHKDDVTSANSCTGLPSVLLAPYGLKAVLTGNSLPHCDAQATKLISDWNRFFSLNGTPADEVNHNSKDTVPPIVEVAVKDTRMLFPSRLVVLPFGSKPETSGLAHFAKAEEKPQVDRLSAEKNVNSCLAGTQMDDVILGNVWNQLSTKKESNKPPVATVKTEGLSTSTSTTTLWDFREALRHSACGCTSSSNVTRTKPVKKFGSGASISRTSYSPASASPKGTSPLTSQPGVMAPVKPRKEMKRSVAFHQRPSHLTDRSHTPPLLPVLPGSRNLHHNVLQGFSSIPIATKDNINPKGNCSYSVLNLKAQDDQNPVLPTETLRNIEGNLTMLQNKLAHLKSSVTVSGYLKKKALVQKENRRRRTVYRLPKALTRRPPALEEDLLEASRPSDDFSVYDSRDLLSPSLNNTASAADLPYPVDSALVFSPSVPDTEKSKQPLQQGTKRTVSTDNSSHENIFKKIKKEAPSPTDVSFLQQQGSETSPHMFPRLPNSQSSEKKARGQGRPRGRKGSNIQSPTSPGSDVFSPVFDDEPATSPGMMSKKKGGSGVKGRDPSLASPPHPKSKGAHSRGKKRLGSGRGVKDQIKQENVTEPYNLLLNPPPNILAPTNNKMMTVPSPQSSHFSPPTPRHSARLLNIKDLQVSENDLNMLFDTDDEDDPPKQSHKSNTHTDSSNHFEDTSKSALSQTLVTSAGLTQQDLAQMFPTPPSQEPAIHAASPATPGHAEYLNPGSIQSASILSPEKAHVPMERESVEQHLAPSFELPEFAAHPADSLFKPLKELPSSLLPSVSCEVPVYKPSSQLKPQVPELKTTVMPPLRIKSPPELGPSSINVSPGILCQNTLSAVSGSVLPGAGIIRPQLPTPTEIPPLTPSPLIKTLRPEFPVPSSLGSYDMDSQSLKMTLILSDSIVNNFDCKRDESAEVNLWLSEVDSRLWSSANSKDSVTSNWPLFADDEPLIDYSGRMNLPQFSSWLSSRPSSLALPETSLFKTEKEKVKLEMSQAFVKLVSDQWSSPFSSQYLETVIENFYTPWRTGNEQVTLSESAILESLQTLRPKLQEALQKPLRRSSWDLAKVEGPATFQSLHKFATKVGLQGNFAVQPLLVGHSGDWMSLSPNALRYWEKLLLEPFAGRRDIAYIAVAPDSETVLESTRWFFKELSSLYESLNLGQHTPITNVLREGILKIRETALQTLAQESVDDWFTQDETDDSLRMKLIAQTCKGHLGAHLKQTFTSDLYKGKGSGSSGGGAMHSSGNDDSLSDDEKASTPAIVIYMVDPFHRNSGKFKSPLWSVTGLFRSFAEMVHNFPPRLKQNVFVQIVPVDLILKVKIGSPAGSTQPLQPYDLRQLAVCVYSQCRTTPRLINAAKSLTRFGNAIMRESLVFKRQNENQLPGRVYMPPFALASAPNLIYEELHSLNGFGKALKAQDINVLYCCYCLSMDRNWIFTVCSDKTGELSEACIIKMSTSKRNAKGSANSRLNAVRKVWDFVYGVISFTTSPWRVIFSRFGKPGRGELQDFISVTRKVINRKSVAKSRLSETCRACDSMDATEECPVIRSVSYTTVETDIGIKLLQRSRRDKRSTAKSRVYVVPPLQSLANQQSLCPPSRQTPVTWGGRNEDEFLPDASILLGGPEEDGTDQDFLPLLTSPSDPNGLVYSSGLISPSSEMPGPFMTTAGGIPSSGVCDTGQSLRLGGSRDKVATSPFQPITQKPSFGLGSPSCHSASPGGTSAGPQTSDEIDHLLGQPLAVGYLLSSCGHQKQQERPRLSRNDDSMVVKSELRFHFVSEDVQPCLHHLDSNNNLEILRHVLEQLDSLSWLTVDPGTGERRSPLAVHLYLLLGFSEYFQYLLS